MKQFQVVKASGSHFEVGYEIGRQLCNPIQKTLYDTRLKVGLAFPRMLQELQPYTLQVSEHFPQYLDEVRGISEGAKVPFDEYFLGNTMEVLNRDRLAVDSNHCTIVAIPYEGGYVIGHNEDAQGYSAKDLYVLDATIEGIRIFGLSYVDSLIGSCVAMNGVGLVEAINSLPEGKMQYGVPRNFIARAVLDCKSFEEVERLFTAVPRASGYNHVLVKGNQLWNIESNENQVEIEKVSGKKYVHTNHCLTSFLVDYSTTPEIDSEDSVVRYNKVSERLVGVNSVEDLKILMSDQTAPAISKEDTIGSAIFEPNQARVSLTYGRPKDGSYYQISLED